MQPDTMESFLSASVEARLLMALDPAHRDALRHYLGDSAFAEYEALAERTRPKLTAEHLGVGAPKNLVFVPGVMGSLLKSDTLGGVWWIDLRALGHLKDLRLADNGLEDADHNHQVVPFATDLSYEGFLAAVLARDDFGHITFPYDWRKPLTASAAALRDLVLRLYDTNGNAKVHLVAHSMGGLAVRAALMEHGEALWPKLGRIVFIATPHYGSPAIAGYVKNHLWGFELLALLGRYMDRKTLRSLWGMLELLPAPREVYPGTRPHDSYPWRPQASDDPYIHPCSNFDMYEASAWKLDLSAEDERQLQRALDGAAGFHRRMYHAHQELDQERRDRMAVIAGVGQKTLFRLAFDWGFLGLWERTAKVMSRIEGDPHREGDGRVPVASAALENVGDIRYVKGVHGGLPMMPQVYEDVFRWLNGQGMQLPQSPRGALAEHLAGAPIESETPHLDGTARGNPAAGDPGYWDLQPPDPSQVEQLKIRLEAGQLPEFISVRLL